MLRMVMFSVLYSNIIIRQSNLEIDQSANIQSIWSTWREWTKYQLSLEIYSMLIKKLLSELYRDKETI